MKTRKNLTVNSLPDQLLKGKKRKIKKFTPHKNGLVELVGSTDPAITQQSKK